MRTELPQGYRDISYLVLDPGSPLTFAALPGRPTLQAAIKNSTVVQRFGTIVIYQVRNPIHAQSTQAQREVGDVTELAEATDIPDVLLRDPCHLEILSRPCTRPSGDRTRWPARCGTWRRSRTPRRWW